LVIDTAGIAAFARWMVISLTPSPQLVAESESLLKAARSNAGGYFNLAEGTR
jgi:hypothetical protein